MVLGRRQKFLPQHLLQWPTRLQRLGRAGGQGINALAHAAHFFLHQVQQLLGQRAIARLLAQLLHGVAHGRQAGAVAFGQAVQHAVALMLLGKALRHIVQQQHKARQRPALLVLLGQDGGHLHAQPLARGGVGDKLRHGPARAPGQALANGVQRMLHQAPVQQRIHRAAHADHRALVGRAQLGAGAVVVQQDAAIQVAHQHRLLQLGNQGGQAVFLLLHPHAGLLHLLGHVLAQAVALGGQGLHLLG